VSEETKRWIRHQPDRRENLLALSAGLGVALIVGGPVLYLARMLAVRELLQAAPSRDDLAHGGPEEREAR
jgi:hypothetical protein